jgi:hypothetical protein
MPHNKQEKNMPNQSTLVLRAAPEALAGLAPLAREGFGVAARPGAPCAKP